MTDTEIEIHDAKERFDALEREVAQLRAEQSTRWVSRFGLAMVLCIGLVASVALAAQLDIDQVPRWMQSGFYVMPKSQAAQLIAANKVTRVLGASATIDVATVTAACNDSAGTTITGAQVGDPCFVGAPTTITGAGTGLSSSFTCYVSAADTVKLRHCPVGTAADDPASATWFFRVISSQ